MTIVDIFYLILLSILGSFSATMGLLFYELIRIKFISRERIRVTKRSLLIFLVLSFIALFMALTYKFSHDVSFKETIYRISGRGDIVNGRY
jgi:H+/Cl- antiporter ClcA